MLHECLGPENAADPTAGQGLGAGVQLWSDLAILLTPPLVRVERVAACSTEDVDRS